MHALEIIQILLIIPIVIVSLLYPQRLSARTSIVIISPVVLWALYLLLNHQTLNLFFISQGLIIAFLLFIVSLWITEKTNLATSLKEYLTNIQAFIQIDYQKFQDWDSILYISFMVIYEELIWRVFLIETLSHYLYAVPVIFIASFLFYYSHAKQRNFSRQSVDLFLFSLIITIIYYFSNSFALVVLIHWIRNMIIIANSIGANEVEKSAKIAPNE